MVKFKKLNKFAKHTFFTTFVETSEFDCFTDVYQVGQMYGRYFLSIKLSMIIQ